MKSCEMLLKQMELNKRASMLERFRHILTTHNLGDSHLDSDGRIKKIDTKNNKIFLDMEHYCDWYIEEIISVLGDGHSIDWDGDWTMVLTL